MDNVMWKVKRLESRPLDDNMFVMNFNCAIKHMYFKTSRHHANKRSFGIRQRHGVNQIMAVSLQ